MNSKTIKKLLCLTMATAMSLTAFAGCGGNGGTDGDVQEVTFWVSGTQTQLEMNYQMVNAFNNSYGKEHGIKVKATEVLSSGYMGTVTSLMGSSTAPDVVSLTDPDYKKWVIGGYIEDISNIYNEYTDIDLGEIAPLSLNRLRYNVEKNTSNENDPLYALPVDAMPAAIYFNKGMMEKAGIIVISVDEEKLDDWNANKIADNYGKRKSDYAKLNNVTVPAKGYYRSVYPYDPSDVLASWTAPTSDEVVVFNNRIAMNWDESEDLGRYFTKSYDGHAGSTTYGYFTENWFNYVWSVGGDCLYDLTGDGEWNFGLLDPNPNYIVNEGCTFTGRTGVEYKAGETIAFYDKMDAAEGETLVPDAKGGYLHSDGKTECGIWSIIKTEIAKGENSALTELPSARTAFKRYLTLSCQKGDSIEDLAGLKISPNPADITDLNPIYKQFYSGDVLMFAGFSHLIQEVAEYADDYNLEWDVAPLVKYKKYKNASDPQCDEVVAEGVAVAYSNTKSLAVNKHVSDERKDAAKQFVKWFASVEGQKTRAKLGFIPTQLNLLDEIDYSNEIMPKNANVFAEALEYARPGDWWYMPDTYWSEAWCIDLNTNVRNGKKTFEAWYPTAIANTNAKLKEYTKYDR